MNSSLQTQFREIEIKRPADLIIEQIRALISSGVLRPGQRLPSERALSEQFGVGRGYVRDALRKLEFYGIVKTLPQSGTVVEDIGVRTLDGLIGNLIGLAETDFGTLMEVRAVLEVQCARLAARRRTPEQLAEIQISFATHERLVARGDPGYEEDPLFHLKVAEASGNQVLRSLVGLFTPDVIRLTQAHGTCRDDRFREALEEHRAVLKGIESSDPEAAADAMARHIEMSLRQYKNIIGKAVPARRHS
jgi:GntR family transcriptional repressor for pyruvate dehydrogenase complex